jgi:hypothetical protein
VVWRTPVHVDADQVTNRQQVHRNSSQPQVSDTAAKA